MRETFKGDRAQLLFLLALYTYLGILYLDLSSQQNPTNNLVLIYIRGGVAAEILWILFSFVYHSQENKLHPKKTSVISSDSFKLWSRHSMYIGMVDPKLFTIMNVERSVIF